MEWTLVGETVAGNEIDRSLSLGPIPLAASVSRI